MSCKCNICFCNEKSEIDSNNYELWITIAISLFAIGISIYFANSQKKQLDKQDKRLSKQDEKLEIHNDQLDKSINKIEKIYQNLKTIDTPNFPKNIEKIIPEIFEFCINKKYNLEIYTDVGGYAILSNNKLWNNYYSQINECIKNGVDVWWYFYNDALQVHQREMQFREYENNNNVDKLIKKANEYKENIWIHDDCKNHYSGCALQKGNNCPVSRDGERECRHIMALDPTYDSLVQTLEKLQRITNDNVKKIEDVGFIKKIKRLCNELPFFAWFAIEIKDGNKVPIKGIISYNVLKGDITEKGFITENKELLSVLYDIMQYHIENSPDPC